MIQSSNERISALRTLIKDNINQMGDKITAASARVGRDPNRIKLLAVTKSADIDCIKAMLSLGLVDFGESRVPQLVQRSGEINDFLAGHMLSGKKQTIPKPRWHMIGHLQRNKVKPLLPLISMIHSVDTLRLAEEIDTYAAKVDKVQDVLIEVNVSGEEQKYGLPVAATGHLIEQMLGMPNIRVCGLMTMAPIVENPIDAKPFFERLYEIFLEVKVDYRLGAEFEHLSMGMSQDYETAVECGATMVRVGSAIFEGLEKI
jgi:PLP dependent protein